MKNSGKEDVVKLADDIQAKLKPGIAKYDYVSM